jgi:hypothetical protein
MTAGYGISNSGTTTVTQAVGLTTASNQITGDVSLNNAGNYFDGPSMAQGTTGTWFASGTVTLNSTTSDQFRCKLWDGTTVVSASDTFMISGDGATSMSLSGFLTSPGANIKISCPDISSTNGVISANASANGNKDSSVFGLRIQ